MLCWFEKIGVTGLLDHHNLSNKGAKVMKNVETSIAVSRIQTDPR
jgi:hypothetical protein